MKETKEQSAAVRHLREQLAKAANDYVLELHRQWGMPRTADDYWLYGEEEPLFGFYSFGAEYFITLEMIQYIVDNEIKREEYDMYSEYWHKLCMISADIRGLNFRDWREHPERRVNTETIERIMKLKEELDKEIDMIKGTTD